MTAVERAADVIGDALTITRSPTLIAQGLDDAGLLVTDEAKAVLDAAYFHRSGTEEGVLRYDCWSGNCDHDEGGCPEETVTVCLSCRGLNYEINDELLHDDSLAENCAVCVAVDAYLASRQVTT